MQLRLWKQLKLCNTAASIMPENWLYTKEQSYTQLCFLIASLSRTRYDSGINIATSSRRGGGEGRRERKKILRQWVRPSLSSLATVPLDMSVNVLCFFLSFLQWWSISYFNRTSTVLRLSWSRRSQNLTKSLHNSRKAEISVLAATKLSSNGDNVAIKVI